MTPRQRRCFEPEEKVAIVRRQVLRPGLHPEGSEDSVATRSYSTWWGDEDRRIGTHAETGR